MWLLRNPCWYIVLDYSLSLSRTNAGVGLHEIGNLGAGELFWRYDGSDKRDEWASELPWRLVWVGLGRLD